MSGPTLGIGRITIPYTVSGLTHVSRMYVANPTLVGSDWNVDIIPSTGGTAVWTVAADGFAAAISYVLPTGTTPGSALLEEYSVTGWLPRSSATVTLPNLAGNAALAGQLTLSLRDENFTRPKIVVMEPNQDLPLKITSPTAGPGGLDGFVDAFLGSSSVSGRPWFFMVNQHGFFLQTNPFISAVGTFNRKLRRARGFA